MLDQQRTVKMRALQSHDVAMQHKDYNKAAMAEKRASIITVDKAIDNFLSKAKIGPDFICVCCNRVMYKQTVVPYNKAKYAKASTEPIEKVFCVENSYISSDGKQWVCKTCDGALSRGNMPVQAKANGLQLCTTPAELSNLNTLNFITCTIH